MDFRDRKLNGPKRVNSQVLFREVQKMNQIWVWLIIAIPVILSWYGAYQQLLLGKPFGDNGNRNQSLLFMATLYSLWGMDLNTGQIILKKQSLR